NDRVPLNLAGMSLERGEEAVAAPGVEATAWFTWTAPDDGFLDAKTRVNDFLSLSPVVLWAYFGSELATLTRAGGNPDHGSPLLLPVRRGDTVQLSAGCARNEAVPVVLAVDFLPTLTNDSFQTRGTITGSAVRITGHNVGARSATNAIIGPTVWWTWIPSISGIAQIQASNFVPSQVIAVYRGDQPATFSLLAQMNLYYYGNLVQNFPVQAGEPLQIAMTSPTGYPVGPFDFKLVVLPNAANNTFATRFSRTADEWSETL